MIVVIGSPLHVPGDDDRPSAADGLAVRIGRAAVAHGARVELVGSVGDDPAGDATLLALARDGIGHAATRRDPSRATPAMPPAPLEPELEIDEVVVRGDEDAADDLQETSLGPFGSAALDGPDLDLALRYLDGVRVVIVAERLAPSGPATVAAAADFLGATFIHLTEPGPPGGDPDGGRTGADDGAGAIVIEAPAADPDGAFARTVGAFAAAVDAGADPAAALEAVVAADGWSPAEA